MKKKSRDLSIAQIQFLESIRNYMYYCSNEITILVDKKISEVFMNFRQELNNIIDDLYLEV
jgi:hypothetical protein